MSQNVLKIQHLNFINYFDSNTFFPHKYALLFSDLLIPQAIISLPFFIISNNLILIFNLAFILTFILNYISSYFFWRILFKNYLVAFFGSLFIVFSPFFHITLDHFQMLSYWPFFFSLFFLIRYEENKNIKNVLLCSLFLAIQFLASVYLAVFLIFSIEIYLLLNLMTTKRIKDFLKINLIVFITFFAIDGVFIKGYIDVKNYYHINREIGEYINYSAHVTDYAFTSGINSLIHKSAPMNRWNNANKNFTMGHASSPGFLLGILALFSLFNLIKTKEGFTVNMDMDQKKGYFVILLLCGLVFSLGPRLNFNGTYSGIPLPYGLLLEITPLLDSVRSPSRWSFIFYVGTIYLSLIAINKVVSRKYSTPYTLLILLIFFLEYIPLTLATEAGKLSDPNLNLLKSTCKKDAKVLLELPVTHLNAADNIAEGLTYINIVQLESIYHQCNLVNGYSGYDLPDNFILADSLDKDIKNQNTGEFLKELRKKKIDLVKFNTKYFIKELKPSINTFLEKIATESGFEKIGTDLYSLSDSK